MNKLNSMPRKFVAAAEILLITLLAACTLSAQSTVCHATGDPAHPYQELTVNSTQLQVHMGHPNDIIPAPAGGCPTTAPATNTSDSKITICHATGSKTNPYVEITVSVNGLNGHDKHSDDIIPAPAGGCPTTKP